MSNPLAITIPDEVRQATKGLTREQCIELMTRLFAGAFLPRNALASAALEVRQSALYDRYTRLSDQSDRLYAKARAALDRARAFGRGPSAGDAMLEYGRLAREADELYDRAQRAYKRATAMWDQRREVSQ